MTYTQMDVARMDCFRAYSYYVDVSMDQQDWARVVDHTKYHCRSWQELYFQPRVAKYIRVVGTHNTVNKVFHLVALEAYFTKKPYNIDPNGILVPKDNVATIGKSACVTEGVCRSRNALLNGETSNYDWDSGYTCHQLGSGAIVVQLGQPYALSSMRLLLWDCDARSYSYYVEVSVNHKTWDVVWDRSRDACKSWQTITFPRRTVVYVKIVGTHNTANEVFHCVHFECPASVTESDQEARLALAVAPSKKGSRPRSPARSSSSSSDSADSVSEAVPSAAAAMVGAGAAIAADDDLSLRGAAVDEGASVASPTSHRSSPSSFAGSTCSQIPVGSSANSMNAAAAAAGAVRRRPSVAATQSTSSQPAQWPGGAAAMAAYVEEQHRHQSQMPSPPAGQFSARPNRQPASSPPVSNFSSPARLGGAAAAAYVDDHFHLEPMRQEAAQGAVGGAVPRRPREPEADNSPKQRRRSGPAE